MNGDQSPWVDIGPGHSICFREWKSDVRALLLHRHPGKDGCECVSHINLKGSTWNAEFQGHDIGGWDVLSWEPLTLSPSLLCRLCADHGFIHEGKWVPA